MNEEDLVEVERLAQVQLEMSAEPRLSTEGMETSQRAAEVIRPSLEEHARASAQAWVAGKKVTGSAALEAKLDRAMAGILEAARLVSADQDALQIADSEARDLSNNLRVLRSASREVREYLQLDLPVLQLGKSEVAEPGEAEATGGNEPSGELPRPYIAARAYFSAVKYLFDEAVFAAYMQAFEALGYFEMHEIWALKPMMQLVVLECIAARFAAKTAASPASVIDEQQAVVSDECATGAISFASLVKSLHRLSHTELKDSFRTLSRTEALLREDPVGAYPLMDFESCDLYRNAIQRFALASDADEFEIARLAVEFSRQAMNQKHSNERARERRGHVGFYLLGRGRKLMKQQIGYKPGAGNR